MKAEDIRKYLKPSKVADRSSTFNNAFASALASFDTYNPLEVRRAIMLLGQDPEQDLSCSYCGGLAATWDHIENTTRNGNYSGFGHHLGNLLPCCRTCNESKRGLNWTIFLKSLPLDECTFAAKHKNIDGYIKHYGVRATFPKESDSYQRYRAIRLEIKALIAEADKIAAQIRAGTIIKDVIIEVEMNEIQP